MSTESSLGTRTIIIHQAGPNCFQVSECDRHREMLGADECLWLVACLLMGRETPYGGMRTIEEHSDEAVQREAKKYQRPFEKLIADRK